MVKKGKKKTKKVKKKISKETTRKNASNNNKKEKTENNNLPSWLVFFSNKVMPPLFFMFMALFSLYFIAVAEPIPLKLNLGVIAIVSSALSIYIATLLM